MALLTLFFVFVGVLALLIYHRVSLQIFTVLCWFLSLILLFFARLHVLTFPLELNVDESGLLAQVLRLSVDPVPWRGFDGTTSGPLATYFAALSQVFVWANPYVTLRFFSLLLTVTSAVLFFYASALLSGTVPAVFFWCLLMAFHLFASQPDFVHHSSEVVPIFLLSIQWLLLAKWSNSFKNDVIISGFLGLLAASVFFTKPQAAPLAVLVYPAQLALLIGNRSNNLRHDFYLITLGWAVGGLLLCVAVLAPVFWTNSFQDFWIRYVIFAIEHKAVNANPSITDTLRLLLISGWEATCVIIGLAACAIGMLLWLTKEKFYKLACWPLLTLAALLVIASIFVITKSRQIFPHYLALAVPQFFLACVIVSRAVFGPGKDQRNVLPQACCSLAGCCAALAFLWLNPQSPLKMMEFSRALRSEDDFLTLIKEKSAPTDLITVWGWAPHYYVLSRRPPAGRDSILHVVLTPGPRQNFYKTKFLQDLEKYKPRFIIDVVSDTSMALTPEWGNDIESLRMEKCPVLGDYLRNNYVLVRVLYRQGAQFPNLLYERVK